MERGGDENITFSFLVIGRHTSKWSLTDWKYLPTEEHVLAASLQLVPLMPAPMVALQYSGSIPIAAFGMLNQTHLK